MAAMTSRFWFGDLIGSLLLREEREQAAKGYALALTSCSRPQDLNFLRGFLHRELVEGHRNSGHEWALACWRHLQQGDRTGGPHAPRVASEDAPWMSAPGTPPETELIGFLVSWVDRFGESVPRANPDFDPLSAFGDWVPVCGAETWAVMEDESARVTLDQWLLANPHVPDDLRSADPLAVAMSTDSSTVLYSLGPGFRPGKWVVVQHGIDLGPLRVRILPDAASAISCMGELGGLG